MDEMVFGSINRPNRDDVSYQLSRSRLHIRFLESYAKALREQLHMQIEWNKELEKATEWYEATTRQQEAVIRRVDEYLTKFRLKPLIRLALRLGLLRLDAKEG